MAMSQWINRINGGRSGILLGLWMTIGSTPAIAQPSPTSQTPTSQTAPVQTVSRSGELTPLPKVETIIILPTRTAQQPAIPTVAPTAIPTVVPTAIPTVAPTVQPIVQPTVVPIVPSAPVEESVRLVVQRSQRRVVVYKGKKVVAKYPIAVGKPGWETPVGGFTVINKEENPIFKSFKTGVIIEPGPDNPLGVRWIGIWTDGKTQLGFHGTDQPELIGKAVSHGCMRMHNKDVIALYKYVAIGTVVQVDP